MKSLRQISKKHQISISNFFQHPGHKQSNAQPEADEKGARRLLDILEQKTQVFPFVIWSSWVKLKEHICEFFYFIYWVDFTDYQGQATWNFTQQL